MHYPDWVCMCLYVCVSLGVMAKLCSEGKTQCISHNVHACVWGSLADVEPRTMCSSTNFKLGKC